MKRVITLVSLLSLFAISSASARPLDVGGMITLRDGGNVVRISVGEEERNDRRSMARRIKRLERAVRALQNRVYDLEDDANTAPREVTVHTCSLPTSFDGVFIGKGPTEIEARANAVNACELGGGFPCGENRVSSCATSVEYLD